LPSPRNKLVADQLYLLILEYDALASMYQAKNYDQVAASRFVTRARASIERVGGGASAYQSASLAIFATSANNFWKAEQLAGVLESLRADVEAGYLNTQRELIHGALFADFLDMAQHLVEEGYKDAAAVIAGSSLEAHLRQLCAKAEIPAHDERDDTLVPRKAERLNADLTKGEVYSVQDQKNVTAWLALRNDAAHGHYERYTPQQVAIMIAGVRDFMTRNPA
jgi:hypothetical protein